MKGKIYLVPVGSVDEDVFPVVGEGLTMALGRGWDVGDPLPYPAYAYHQRRQQYLSDAILNQLRRVTLPAERLLGLIDLDLYTPGLNFVFGQASTGGREALIALPRLRQSFYGTRRRGPLPRDVYQRGCARDGPHLWFRSLPGRDLCHALFQLLVRYRL